MLLDYRPILSPELEMIKQKVNSHFKPIKSRKDTLSFLLQNKLKKDGAKRCLAYLITFGLIVEQQQIGQQIVSLLQNYENFMKSFFNDNVSETLTHYYESSEFKLISNEVPRNLYYFKELCSFMSLKHCINDEILTAQKRILIMESFTDKNVLSFAQGFDRIMFLTHSLSICFMQCCDLDVRYAEPLAYHILQKLLIMINMKEILKNPSGQTLTVIDSNLGKVRQDVLADLKKQYDDGPYSFFFALKWRLLMFADDHKPPEVLLIFDQYIAHIEYVEKYFICLALAHVKQVKYKDPSMIITNLQNTNTVNLKEAIEYANKLFINYEKQAKKGVNNNKTRIK